MNTRKQQFLALVILGLLGLSSVAHASVSTIEDVALPPGGVLNAVTGAPATGFASGGVTFPWDTDPFGFGLPIEFAASNISDTTDYLNDGDPVTQPFDHSFNSITGGGAGPSQQYAVGNALSPINVPLPHDPISVDITNTTYDYYSMLTGDGFAKKFGGVTGEDPDTFVLTITGKNGAATVGSVDVYLADFRNLNGAPDEILSTWRTVDLTSLAGSNLLAFSLSSTDNGAFGMNTPAYFALDNLVLTPEPSAAVLMMIGALGCLRNRRSTRLTACKRSRAPVGG